MKLFYKWQKRKFDNYLAEEHERSRRKIIEQYGTDRPTMKLKKIVHSNGMIMHQPIKIYKEF
jgi:hypothetical protein